MVKIRNIIYDEKSLQQVVSQETTIWLCMNEGTAVLEHLNFNKVISELLAVNVKIDEENKALILLSSFTQSYNHIIITILYGKETLILEDQLSYLMILEKSQIKRSRHDWV